MIKSASAYTIFCVEISAHFYPPRKFSIWKKMISTQQQKTLSLSLETECHRPSKTWQWLLLSLCCLLVHLHPVLTITGPKFIRFYSLSTFLWQKLVFLVNSRKECPGSAFLWWGKVAGLAAQSKHMVTTCTVISKLLTFSLVAHFIFSFPLIFSPQELTNYVSLLINWETIICSL